MSQRLQNQKQQKTARPSLEEKIPVSLPLCLDFTLLPADGTAHQTSALLALDAAVHTDAVVPDEAPDGVDPALVAGEVVVKLAGDAVDLVQAGPGDGGEVVVLVVQADVVGEPVERPVVRKGLGHGDLVGRVALRGRDCLVHVVLGDEVAGDGVQAAGEERGEDEVEQRVARGVADEDGVKGDLHRNVEGVDARERDAVDGHGPDGVEEDLKGAEKGLAKDGVEEEGFERGREIGVEAVDAKRLVVREVVGLDAGQVISFLEQMGGERVLRLRRGFGIVLGRKRCRGCRWAGWQRWPGDGSPGHS